MVISAGPCRPGSFHSNNAGLCSKCHINTYTNSTGSKECLKCPDGTTTFSKGSTECEAYTCEVTDVRGFLKYKCVTSSGGISDLREESLGKTQNTLKSRPGDNNRNKVPEAYIILEDLEFSWF